MPDTAASSRNAATTYKTVVAQLRKTRPVSTAMSSVNWTLRLWNSSETRRSAVVVSGWKVCVALVSFADGRLSPRLVVKGCSLELQKAEKA